jgi:hypothetical protein
LAWAVPSANRAAADAFERIATLLVSQDGDPRRIAAYRRAAATLRRTRQDVGAMARAGGRDALVSLPTIGNALAAEIEEQERTGRIRLLERLEERSCPRAMLEKLPGIGATLAARAVNALGVETLEELELALHDGRLAALAGFGTRRIERLRRALERRFDRGVDADAATPSLALLLELDADYRRLAAQGRLRTIAPQRFNRGHDAWLPVLERERDGWRLTAMFSNTERAHRLETTGDWVVLAYERDGRHGQCTVVTEHRGPDAFLRVIRGRERDCHAHHQSHPPPPVRLSMPTF